MAVLNIVLTTSDTDSRRGGSPLPVAKSIPKATATVTTSGTSAAVTMVAVGTSSIIPQSLSDVWRIKCKGGPATIAFNQAAVANSGMWEMGDGDVLWLGVSSTGETINVITST